MIRVSDEFKKRVCPVMINEDSTNLANCLASVEEYCGWGYYSQGAGSGEKEYDNVHGSEREKDYEKLSGFQTVPVNWSINTPLKKEFFDLVKEITQGR